MNSGGFIQENFSIFQASHEGSWAILAILFLVAYFLFRGGKSKAGTIIHYDCPAILCDYARNGRKHAYCLPICLFFLYQRTPRRIAYRFYGSSPWEGETE
jgi:hypothetical protein